MLRFESDLLAELRRRDDGMEGRRALLAVSGGGDSVAMLVLLVALAPSLDLSLTVAHADHGLRPESGEDAAFVRDLCRHFDLDLVEGALGVRAHAERARLGLETAARELRWAWLEAEATSCGADVAATGHTLDDHTETVLLRLRRGGGLRSLTPLSPRRERRWSPLVHLRREALRDYLRSKGVPWREDATNAEPFTPRNRLRPLIEALRAEAPGLDAHLLETHRQAEEALLLAHAHIASREGARWRLCGSGLDLDRGPWSPVEIRWILARASHDLGWPREAVALRDIASWLHSRLSGKKGGDNGAYELRPEGTGWRLTRREHPSIG